ncbi:protealysin inhibitor emfourin [Marisediminicola sp. LYQ134]|uniref:protealysin inhibitor emfourin n=1 Tax=Marisediminicola sp. LYQ134 TaxID=3391061 RepID=UPI00398306A8
MKITVIRTGGFAGLATRWTVEVDELVDRDEWFALVEALPWSERPAEQDGVDRFVYRIRVSRRRITLPETRVEGPWRELVDRVRAISDPTPVSPSRDRRRPEPAPPDPTPPGGLNHDD